MLHFSRILYCPSFQLPLLKPDYMYVETLKNNFKANKIGFGYQYACREGTLSVWLNSIKCCPLGNNKYLEIKNRFDWVGVTINHLNTPQLCPVQSQDLDFHCHMSWCIFCSMLFEVTGSCMFCWQWGNCWLSLFKLSFSLKPQILFD